MAYEYNILQNENVTPEQWMEMYGARALKDRLRSESLASLNSANAARDMEGYVPDGDRMKGYVPYGDRTKGFMQESEAGAQMSTRFAPREPGVRSLASIMQTDLPESTPRIFERPYLTGDAGQSPNLQDWKQGYATGRPTNQMGLKVPYIKFD